jgi:hypothetical protein
VPNFFIVGAPRCASTSMYAYLRQHPDVFMPDNKEPRFHCTDLDSGSELDGRFFMRDEAEYLGLFEAAGAAKRIGEGCIFNLYSTVAAESIRRMSPEARILILLREPVEQMYSFHAVRRRNASEDLDFAAALDAEADRRAGRRLPKLARNLKMYQYRAVASYTDQVARYFDVFGRDRVLLLIYEELRLDPRAALLRTLDFLEVDPAVEVDLTPANPHRENAVPGLARLLRDPRVEGRARSLLPRGLHHTAGNARRWLTAANMRPVTRAPLDPELRSTLEREFAPEVARLGQLVGRDLAALWYGGSGAAAGDRRQAASPP